MEEEDFMAEDRQDIINRFKEICAVNDEIALAALIEKDWDLEAALRVFLDDEDHDEMPSANPPTNHRQQHDQIDQRQDEQSQQVRRQVPDNVQGNSFLEWLTGFVLAPLKILVWPLRLLFNYFYSMFGGPSLAVADPRAEVGQFVQNFREQYDQMNELPWLEIPYNSAISEARRNISCLLVYVHNPTHRRADEFVRNYLLSPELLNFIREHNCLLWGTSIRSSEGYKVCSALNDFSFPFIALLCIVENRATCMFRVSGEFTLQSMINGLQNASRSSRPMLEIMHEERAHREMNNQLRRQQEDEYQLALAADRAKVQERKRLESEKIENQKREEELRRQEEQKAAALETRRKDILKSLPVEPDVNEIEVVRVSVRFPSGAKFERRFRITDNLELLFNAVISHDSCPRDFSLLSSYPRKEVKCAPGWYRQFSSSEVFSDETQTFQEAGLNGQIALLVKDNEA